MSTKKLQILGSFGGTTPDWNQNDSTAQDYIKNRPFYMEEPVETELIDVNIVASENGGWQNITIETVDGTNYLWMAPLVSPTFVPEDGKEYSVVIGENKYTSVASMENALGSDCIVFGDVDEYINSDIAGFTYVVMYELTSGEKGLIYKGVEAPTECKIYSLEQKVIKLDPKYLPEGGFGYTESDSTVETFDILQIADDLGGVSEMVSADENMTGKQGFMLQLTSSELPINLAIDNEYTITVNGASYTERAVDASNIFGSGTVAFGDLDCVMSNEYSNFRYLVMFGQMEATYALQLMLDAETFGLTEAPTELTISCSTVTEVVHKIDKKFLQESAKPNWNENSSEAEGYIANRTHWVDYVRDVVFEEVERLNAGGYGSNTWKWDVDIEQPNLVVGETYVVGITDFNNNYSEYTCVCIENVGENEEENAIVLGNLDIYNYNDPEETDEPFCIYIRDENNYGIITNNEIFSIAVYHIIEEVHKLDKKFLTLDSELNIDSENSVQNKVVAEAINNLNDNVNNLNTLVGDTSVSEQIDNAIAEIEIPEHTWESLPDKPFEDIQVLYECDVYNNEEKFNNKVSDLSLASEAFIGKHILFITNNHVFFDATIEESLITRKADNAYLIEIPRVPYDSGTTTVNIVIVESGTYRYSGDNLTTGVWYGGFSDCCDAIQIVVPAKQINKNVVSVDWNSNSEFEGGFIKNRTHYVENYGSLTWNGDITGKESILDNYYKVAGQDVATLLTNDVLDASIITVYFKINEEEQIFTGSVTKVFAESDYAFYMSEDIDAAVIVTRKDNVMLLEQIQIPSAGVYFIYSNPDEQNLVYISKILYPTEVKKLSEIYLSDNIVRASNIEEYIPDTIARVSPNVLYEWDDTVVYSDIITINSEYNSSYVKISDDAPEREFFIGKFLRGQGIEDGVAIDVIGTLTENLVIEIENGMYSVDLGNLLVVTVDSCEYEGCVFTKGIWCRDDYIDASNCASKIQIIDQYKPIDEILIPDTIARLSDIPEVNYPVTSVNGQTGDVSIDIPDAVINPTTAKVGQTLIVKAVDENGKPTEWEAVDFGVGSMTLDEIVQAVIAALPSAEEASF